MISNFQDFLNESKKVYFDLQTMSEWLEELSEFASDFKDDVDHAVKQIEKTLKVNQDKILVFWDADIDSMSALGKIFPNLIEFKRGYDYNIAVDSAYLGRIGDMGDYVSVSSLDYKIPICTIANTDTTSFFFSQDDFLAICFITKPDIESDIFTKKTPEEFAKENPAHIKRIKNLFLARKFGL